MKILIACEESQTVTKAFRALGFEAYSCDIQDCSGGHPEWHILGDALKEAYSGAYEMMIAHPPCTDIAVSGTRSFAEKIADGRQEKALEFVRLLMEAPITRICIENPVSVISSKIRKPDQIIHPYYFGDNVPKKTCLWLKNLPPLQWRNSAELFGEKTSVDPQYLIYKSSKNKSGTSKYSIFGKLGKGKGKQRSVFFPGIARAMAEQWGERLISNKSSQNTSPC